MDISHERAYVFTVEGGETFREKQNLLIYGQTQIKDWFIRRNLRVRHEENSKNQFSIAHGSEDRHIGFRNAEETAIDSVAASILSRESVLDIDKKRLLCKRNGEVNDSYKITIDIMKEPMKLVILRIKSLKDKGVPDDIAQQLFGLDLIECPLSAFDFLKRQIGICGTTSAGKSESAKWLSYTLNTVFGANSFHITEYATSFIQKYKRSPTFFDQFFIWYGQRERELSGSNADIIISDCPTFLSYLYTLKLKTEKLDPVSTLYLAKMYKRVLFDLNRYTDIIFLRLKDYKQNKIRYQTVEEAQQIEEKILAFLEDHHIPFFETDYDSFAGAVDKILYLNRVN